jgi:hypothetical protein
MRRRRTAPALACALALAFPAGAAAQSAGDDQYTDPFADQEPQGQQESGGNSGGGGGGGGGNAQPSPQSAQATPASPSATASQAQEPAQGEALPRTGFQALLPLAYGLVLLLSGAALRRGSRSRLP